MYNRWVQTISASLLVCSVLFAAVILQAEESSAAKSANSVAPAAQTQKKYGVGGFYLGMSIHEACRIVNQQNLYKTKLQVMQQGQETFLAAVNVRFSPQNLYSLRGNTNGIVTYIKFTYEIDAICSSEKVSTVEFARQLMKKLGISPDKCHHYYNDEAHGMIYEYVSDDVTVRIGDTTEQKFVEFFKSKPLNI